MCAAWNATCRSAVGVAVVDMRRSGERTSEVRARLGVMGVMDYYNHRVFTWLAKVLLMGQHRYPRLLITATAEVLECERAEHSAAQGCTAAAAEARRGGGARAVGGQAAAGVGAEARGGERGGGRAAAGEAAVVGLAGEWQESGAAHGSGGGGAVAAAARRGGPSAGGGRAAAAGGVEAQEGERAAEGGSGVARAGGSGGASGADVVAAAAWRFGADYAKVGTSHCRVTKRPIARGAVRLYREYAPTGTGGQHIRYYWSLEGIALGLSTEEEHGLRRAVDRGLSGLELLGSDDRRAVELAVSAEMEAAARTARVLPDIVSPAQGDMPWACPRCRQLYKSLTHARRHADQGDCAPKKQKAAEVVVKPPVDETGRVRRSTWLSQTLTRLRRAQGIVEDSALAWRSCDECDRCSGKQEPCDGCLLLECQKLVRTDIGTWQRVVYGGDGDGGEVGAGSEEGRSRGRGAATRRRARFVHQHDAAEGEWEDPRPGWAEDRLRCFVRLQGGVNAACRVREALSQGVGSAQVLEGLMAGRERHPAGGATGVALGACCTIAENRDVERARALLVTVSVWCRGQVGAPVCRCRSLCETALRVLGRAGRVVDEVGLGGGIILL